jgi:hypothetical protein
VTEIEHLDRGYERIEEKLAPLGARIRRVAQGRPTVPAAEGGFAAGSG